MRDALRPLVDGSRSVLRGAARRPRLRRLIERTARELDAALGADGTYDASYYGDERDPFDRMGLSGYERYDRGTSNADVGAYLVWKWLPGTRVLDVGCATGYLVEALRELGLDAQGVDVSRWAVEHAAPGARGHVFTGDLLAGLPYGARRFDVVTTFETLEHLPPADVPRAVRELFRVTRGFLLATIPSFGPNEHGPGGWLESKVRHERLEDLKARGPGWDGPVDHDDLLRDAHGAPIEGHLTIASFRWWTARFEEAGFERCGELERRIHPDIARLGLTKYWNLYVLARPGAVVPPAALRPPGELAAREAAWGLDRRAADPADLEAVRRAVGGA